MCIYIKIECLFPTPLCAEDPGVAGLLGTLWLPGHHQHAGGQDGDLDQDMVKPFQPQERKF